MSQRIVDNQAYVEDVVALTVISLVSIAAGVYVTNVVQAKLAYRKYKKTRSTMAV